MSKHDLDLELLQAAADGDLTALTHLVEKQNANVNCQGALNRTPLHIASLNGKMEVVMYLTEQKAEKNPKDSSGNTPLHLSTLNGHTNVSEFLLSEGADWKITNAAGKKPSDLARKQPMKQLFVDAEKGVFNSEENNNNALPLNLAKKKKLNVESSTVDDLVALGYDRPKILDAMLTIAEEGKETNKIPLLIQTLEKKVKEDKEKLGSKEEVKTEDNDCKICFVAKIDVVLTPCGHLVVCNECSNGLNSCPICRQHVSKAIKMFKA